MADARVNTKHGHHDVSRKRRRAEEHAFGEAPSPKKHTTNSLPHASASSQYGLIPAAGYLVLVCIWQYWTRITDETLAYYNNIVVETILEERRAVLRAGRMPQSHHLAPSLHQIAPRNCKSTPEIYQTVHPPRAVPHSQARGITRTEYDNLPDIFEGNTLVWYQQSSHPHRTEELYTCTGGAGPAGTLHMGQPVPIPEAERRGTSGPFTETYFNEFDGIDRPSYQARLATWRAQNHEHPNVRATQSALRGTRDSNDQESLYTWFHKLVDWRTQAIASQAVFPDHVVPGYDRLDAAAREQMFADFDTAFEVLGLGQESHTNP